MQLSFEIRKSNKEYTCSQCKKQIKNKSCYLHKCMFDEKNKKYINTEICKDCANGMLKNLYLKYQSEKACES